MRLNPHFLICETTNIFFNAAWVLRAAGWRGNPVVLAFEYLFALSFFPLRILNLTVVIWVLQTKVRSMKKHVVCLCKPAFFEFKFSHTGITFAIVYWKWLGLFSFFLFQGASLGFAKYTLHPIGAMQYFWCYKILSMIHTRYSSPVKEISSVQENSKIVSEEKVKKCE